MVLEPSFDLFAVFQSLYLKKRSKIPIYKAWDVKRETRKAVAAGSSEEFAKAEIAQSFSQAIHFNTYGGNPISSAGGKAVLEATDEDGVQKNSEVVGTYFLEELLKVKNEFPDVVGDVGGKGLMIGVELVTDKESKTPLPPEKFVPIWEDCKDMRVLMGKGGLYGNVLRIKPPMCITKDDVNFGVAAFRTALQKYSHSK